MGAHRVIHDTGNRLVLGICGKGIITTKSKKDLSLDCCGWACLWCGNGIGTALFYSIPIL